MKRTEFKKHVELMETLVNDIDMLTDEVDKLRRNQVSWILKNMELSEELEDFLVDFVDMDEESSRNVRREIELDQRDDDKRNMGDLFTKTF